MTAEILLMILLLAATALAAGVGALILSAFGSVGWLFVFALIVTAAMVWRLAAAPADWNAEDLQDDWRAG